MVTKPSAAYDFAVFAAASKRHQSFENREVSIQYNKVSFIRFPKGIRKNSYKWIKRISGYVNNCIVFPPDNKKIRYWNNSYKSAYRINETNLNLDQWKSLSKVSFIRFQKGMRKNSYKWIKRICEYVKNFIVFPPGNKKTRYRIIRTSEYRINETNLNLNQWKSLRFSKYSLKFCWLCPDVFNKQLVL